MRKLSITDERLRPGSGGNLKESFPGWVVLPSINHHNSLRGEGKTLYGQET
jgi:hypothetical protein